MLALLPIAAYLCGSIPFGYLICRARGIDVREQGSGNIGATNVARTLGKRSGALVLLLDLAKGLIPVLVARWVVGDQPGADRWIGAAMLAAVAGHVYPAFLRLRGGKGVATAFGVILAVCPLAGALGFVVYVGLYLATRISSVGSLGGTLTAVVTLWLLGARLEIGLAGSMIMLLILLRHRGNLARLRRGEERAS